MPLEHSPYRRGDNESEQTQTNRRLVTLIQGKLLPLNRGRYEHLQKINKVHRKNKYISQSDKNMTVHVQDDSFHMKVKVLTTRAHKQQEESQTDVLLKRLKSLNIRSKRSSIKDKDMPVFAIPSTSELFPVQSIEDQCRSTWKLSTFGGKFPTARGKQSLFDLVVKAEDHLRVKKRALKERYSDKSGIQRERRTPLQGVLGTLGHKMKGGTDEQIEKEMLKDIRLGMLEAKMNRMKLDINHKKIVQLR